MSPGGLSSRRSAADAFAAPARAAQRPWRAPSPDAALRVAFAPRIHVAADRRTAARDLRADGAVPARAKHRLRAIVEVGTSRMDTTASDDRLHVPHLPPPPGLGATPRPPHGWLGHSSRVRRTRVRSPDLAGRAVRVGRPRRRTPVARRSRAMSGLQEWGREAASVALTGTPAGQCAKRPRRRRGRASMQPLLASQIVAHPLPGHDSLAAPP
jgi:hypothetical protein